MTDSPANLVEEFVAFLSNVLGRSESTVVAYRGGQPWLLLPSVRRLPDCAAGRR